MPSSNDLNVCTGCGDMQWEACLSQCETRMLSADRSYTNPFFPGQTGSCAGFTGVSGDLQVCVRYKTHEDCSALDFPISVLLTHVEAAGIFVAGMVLLYTQIILSTAKFMHKMTELAVKTNQHIGHSFQFSGFYSDAILVSKVAEATAGILVGILPQSVPGMDASHRTVVAIWWVLLIVNSLVLVYLTNSSFWPFDWCTTASKSPSSGIGVLSACIVYIFTATAIVLVVTTGDKDWDSADFFTEYSLLVFGATIYVVFVLLVENLDSPSISAQTTSLNNQKQPSVSPGAVLEGAPLVSSDES